MIDVKHLSKSFGDHLVLDDISEHIYPGDKVVIIGPSGSGKSTFLRSLNLLEEPSAGSITFDGVEITSPKTDIDKVRRQMGMVFQHFNLFPNMTIQKNITLAPVRTGLMTQAEADEKAMQLLARVGLTEKAGAYPNQLSGGQKQRIAIVRALAMNPKVMLFDEPTSGTITFDGVEITDPKTDIDQVRRKMGMVFQYFNLFPNMTIRKNITLAPVRTGLMKQEEADETAIQLLKRVGLEEKADAYPAQLSGGQKQRVAIARALATNPKYLLCEEATSALDPNTTRSILELLRTINQTMGVTIIVITHEMKVIDQICDRVAVIDNSQIAEEGRVSEVFTNPQSDIARDLILPQDRAALDTAGGRRVRLTFDGLYSQAPIISQMVLDCQAPVNILFADTKEYEGVIYGHMIIELPTDERQADKIIAWLSNSQVGWKEEK